MTQALDILVADKRDEPLDIRDSRPEKIWGVHTNLVDNDSKWLVNRVIGLRLVEERESIFEWRIG